MSADGRRELRRPSTRDIADLARAGFELARQASMAVDFEVHHLTDRPVDLRALVPGRSANGHARTGFLETVTYSANGTGVVIGTRTRGRDDVGTPGRHEARGATAVPEVSPDRWVFRQSASPNPTFIYESAQTYEGLIAVDPDATETCQWHGAALRDLASDICALAANVAHAPLLTLQSPAQLPGATRTRDHDLRTRKETPPIAPSSVAVRFSVALHEASAELFFVLSDRIRVLCEENGYGLWLADSRPGHRGGNWFEVCKPDRPGRHHRDVPQGDDQIDICLPVTCVGPARVGSTYAIISSLRRYARVGLVSCADCTLDDLALIHLQLTVRGVPVDRLNKIITNMTKNAAISHRPRDVLAELFLRLGVSAASERDRPDELSARAGDYQTFLGPAVPYRPRAATARLPVWISWQITKKEDGLATPLSCLYQALDGLVPTTAPRGHPVVPLSALTDVEYLICRSVDRSVLRGKGKLSVPVDVLTRFDGAGGEAPASTFCVLLEEAWRARMDAAEVTGVGELTVAWREYWLGHSTYT